MASAAAPHESLGMCRTCHRRTIWRLRDAIQRAEAECESRPIPVVRDLTEVARAALHRSLDAKREAQVERRKAVRR